MKIDPEYRDEIITVFHGTSIEYAEIAVREQRIKASLKGWDWLGHGIYFWEKYATMGISYAREKYPFRWAVLKTQVKLGHCMDLTDQSWNSALNGAYNKLIKAHSRDGVKLPENKDGRHNLDCAVINVLSEIFNIDTVRAPFNEGNPIYPNSYLRDSSNIQIVVRNVENIIGEIEIFHKG